MGNTQRMPRLGVPFPRPRIFQFTVAVGATMVGLLLTGLLAPLLGGPYFLLALAAVALSALYGGLSAGLLTTGLSALASATFSFLPSAPSASTTRAMSCGSASSSGSPRCSAG
ncbi:hypothetical protein [Archangium sp.]|uniref:hypothetical protein n=1 Tax=Archangium sp. TaxID=1872627 RepID=UPI002ED93435